MGTIEINTEPHELIIDGTTILMQADPTADKAWDQLLELEVTYKDAKSRAKNREAWTETVAALAHSPEDADTLRKLNLGVPTLRAAARAYIREVTGFPTQPSSRSNKA